uniref:Uncharacterized protein n=1 Tax=uncultured bacterium EC5 TaxID=672206 RepID=G4WV74_9BACT|nr:hypothetical protein [uncultured bacterium EC5]
MNYLHTDPDRPGLRKRSPATRQPILLLVSMLCTHLASCGGGGRRREWRWHQRRSCAEYRRGERVRLLSTQPGPQFHHFTDGGGDSSAGADGDGGVGHDRRVRHGQHQERSRQAFSAGTGLVLQNNSGDDPLAVPDHVQGLPELRALSLCTCCRHYPGTATGGTALLIRVQ